MGTKVRAEQGVTAARREIETLVRGIGLANESDI
jgi:hypothetical protein